MKRNVCESCGNSKRYFTGDCEICGGDNMLTYTISRFPLKKDFEGRLYTIIKRYF